MKEWILAALIAGVAAIGGVVSRVVFKKKPDNFVEEFAEKVIKDQTGVNVDLSPDTPDPEGFNVIDVSGSLKKNQKKEEKKD